MKKVDHRQIKQTPSIECPECDSPQVFTRPTEHKFKYGSGEKVVELECVLPVRVCAECGAEFVDDEGERVRNDIVCRHLGVLTPDEIHAIREREGTRASFADLTGIGEASLSRWESGASPQTKAFDNYLFLLRFQDNIERLKSRGHDFKKHNGPQIEGRFRSVQITEQRLLQKRRFVLRPAA